MIRWFLMIAGVVAFSVPGRAAWADDVDVRVLAGDLLLGCANNIPPRFVMRDVRDPHDVDRHLLTEDRIEVIDQHGEVAVVR